MHKHLEEAAMREWKSRQPARRRGAHGHTQKDRKRCLTLPCLDHHYTTSRQSHPRSSASHHLSPSLSLCLRISSCLTTPHHTSLLTVSPPSLRRGPRSRGNLTRGWCFMTPHPSATLTHQLLPRPLHQQRHSHSLTLLQNKRKAAGFPRLYYPTPRAVDSPPKPLPHHS